MEIGFPTLVKSMATQNNLCNMYLLNDLVMHA